MIYAKLKSLFSRKTDEYLISSISANGDKFEIFYRPGKQRTIMPEFPENPVAGQKFYYKNFSWSAHHKKSAFLKNNGSIDFMFDGEKWIDAGFTWEKMFLYDTGDKDGD